MNEPIAPSDIARFYQAVLLGLRVLDQMQSAPSRFGSGSDARWASFRGHLGTTDRIDILVRDAAVKWEAAFSPARAFALPGVAPDDPFGPDWPGLDEPSADSLWQAVVVTPPLDPRAALALAARTLGATDGLLDGSLDALVPTSKLLIGGLRAIWKVAEVFVGRSDLRWADQVVVAADQAAERQLAALAAPILQAARATQLVIPMPTGTSPPSDRTSFTHRILSDDASPAVATALRGRRDPA